MDSYLAEQHSYQLGRESQAEEVEEESNEHSWVMLRQQGEVVPLPQEEILLKGRGRISFELIAREKGRPGRDPLPPKCPDGKLYLTNRRIIYLAAKPTEVFKSFSTQILNVEDSHVSSPSFGAWYWKATVVPEPNGGIPPDYALVDIKASFCDGGGSAFYEKYVSMRENLLRAREAGASFATDEQLPQYEERARGTPASAVPIRNTDPIPPPPDGPPPDYEETQAQAVAEQLDDRLRQGTATGQSN